MHNITKKIRKNGGIQRKNILNGCNYAIQLIREYEMYHVDPHILQAMHNNQRSTIARDYLC